MNKNTLLKKYNGKIKTQTEIGLLRESDFKEIVITNEYSSKRLQKVLDNCTTRRKNEDGDFVGKFDKKLYRSMLVLETCEFDGRKLTRAEVERLESSFLSDLYVLASKEEDIPEKQQEKPED